MTATVLGSVRHDSGTAWTISVRDSAIRSTDTAIAIQRPDKSQAWLKGSLHLRVELQPWDGRILNINGAGPLLAPWGLQSMDPNGWKCNGVFGYQITPAAGGLSNGWVNHFCFEGGSTSAVPEGVWIDTVGPLVFRFFGAGMTELRLSTYNHRSIDQAPYYATPRLPKIASTIEWEERVQSAWYNASADTGHFTHHQWKVIDQPSDSSGWSRIRIRDSSIDDSGRVTDLIRDLRFDLGHWTSEVRPDRFGTCPGPEDAWMGDWSDSVTKDGVLRIAQIGSSSSAYAGADLHTVDYFEKIGSNNQIDSVSCVEMTHQVSSFTTFTTRTLISVNGVQVRKPKITAVVRPPKPRVVSSLQEIGLRYPRLSMHWTDAAGHKGQLPVSAFSSINKFCPRGPVFLTIILPDGSIWKASTLIP